MTIRSFGRRTVLASVPMLAGCSLARLPPPPRGTTDQIAVLGLPNARFWVDRGTQAMVEEGHLAFERELAAGGDTTAPVAFLSISGGSDFGAFGAGLLNGWTAAGNRPEFKLVTGVSTGALTAPFAYLGSAYDARLKGVFTNVTQRDIFLTRGATAVLTDDALADNSPLFRLISRELDEAMLAAIAREYGRGRLLFIGTTNIDLQRPVLWNIGAIAASGHPGALILVRKILLASAAIPGAFPPVMIEVEHEGRRYEEMHVDGGAVAQAFLYPTSLRLDRIARKHGVERERVGYLIRNGRVDPEWTTTSRSFFRIASRAIETMIHYSGLNDIVRIYFTTQRDGVGFRLAYIPESFDVPHPAPFDPGFMNALFDYGYEKARQGYPWATVPPGHEEPVVAAVRPARQASR